ncbi:MAG: hypothetical protein HC819_05725 [Cyclobacteriaceae bacterium]|nr:hypothetical protein [Cyclobacteriaceae bacterium]
MLNKEKTDRLIKGYAHGQVFVRYPLREIKFWGQLALSDLRLQNVPLGQLTTDFDYQQDRSMHFSMQLQDTDNLISTAGSYHFTEEKPDLRLQVNTDISNARVFLPLFQKYIRTLNGQVSGNFTLSGQPDNLQMDGGLQLHNLESTPRAFNSTFLNNGQISIKDNVLVFESYQISDSLHNILDLSGSIDFNTLENPLFDVHIFTNDFLAIDSYSSPGNLLTGKLMLGAEADITGRTNKLVIQSTIGINKGTDLTYILPGNSLELINSEGIVDFVDFAHSHLNEEVEANPMFMIDSLATEIQGVDFSTNINIDPAAKFSIFIDPNAGDITTFRLKGNLLYQYNDKLRGHLRGMLELEEGFYDLSFYGLVKKKFIYDKGSTISWSGNIMDGVVDFSARYVVKTNSVGLVSNEISSYETSAYNQRLPYEVVLNVTEQISNPTISFGIDLENNQRSINPMVDAKLKALNMPNMESERNKQVFALLVAGTFIPDNPNISEVSSSFASSAVRNSVNSILTQQLNNLTGQFVKVVNLDMGVNTFDDYTTGQSMTKTQLDVKVSKNLFNNRVSAELESHIDLDGSNPQPGQRSTSGLPEYAVSYNITKSGNYRIKAFRENAYDIYDGEIQNSGLALIFIHEFNHFGKKDSGPHSNSQTPKIK